MFPPKVRPVVIHHIEIRVHGLHRQKTRKTPSSSPPYNQVDSGNLRRLKPRPYGSILISQIPLPAVIHQKVNLHSAFSKIMSGGKGKKLLGKHGGFCISQHKQAGVFLCQLLYRCHAGPGKCLSLDRGPFCVICRKTIKGHFANAQFPAHAVQGHSG